MASARGPSPDEPLLALHEVGKRYGNVVALQGINLEVRADETLALCGDNGAGKSSLAKILSGAEQPTSGRMILQGRAVRFASPHDALLKGVATIYQDLALAPRLSVAANVFLGSELRRAVVPGLVYRLDKHRMRQEARRYLGQLSSSVVDMRAPVERLSGGQRQAVAIARALRWQARIVIMDEPTAALGVKESAQVLALIERLRAEGRSVVLISHNMRDVERLADRVVILRGGHKVADRPAAGLDADALATLVMG